MAKKKFKNMTKSAFYQRIAESLGEDWTKKDVIACLDEMQVIVYRRADKGGVVIPGIGKLVVVTRKARRGRNPATGEALLIPKRQALKFKIAPIAKRQLAPKGKQKKAKVIKEKK